MPCARSHRRHRGSSCRGTGGMLFCGTRPPKPINTPRRRASADSGNCGAMGTASVRAVLADAAAVSRAQPGAAMRHERTQRHDARRRRRDRQRWRRRRDDQYEPDDVPRRELSARPSRRAGSCRHRGHVRRLLRWRCTDWRHRARGHGGVHRQRLVWLHRRDQPLRTRQTSPCSFPAVERSACRCPGRMGRQAMPRG